MTAGSTGSSLIPDGVTNHGAAARSESDLHQTSHRLSFGLPSFRRDRRGKTNWNGGMSPQTWGSPPSCPRVTARIVCSELISGTVETRKIDPLNRKQYGAVSAALTVTDVAAAVSFYQKAFGFAKRGIMKGPDGKPVHAELTLRGTTLMLGPESPAMEGEARKALEPLPTLFIYTSRTS